MTGSNTFSVTDVRTAHKASKCATILQDRRDIGCMWAQRRTATTHGRNTLQALLVADYKATICTRSQHIKFLAMVIGEVPNYHQRVNGAQISPKAMQLLLANLTDILQESPQHDPYPECLRFLSSKRVYRATFGATANQPAQFEEVTDLPTPHLQFSNLAELKKKITFPL